MPIIFFGGPNSSSSSKKQFLQMRYMNARSNLLLAIIFTVLNIGFLITQKYALFMFYAYIPYFLAQCGMMYTGRLPAEFYAQTGVKADKGKEFFYIMLAAAVVTVVLYIVCWVFSKGGRYGWLVAALVLFSIDSAALLLLNGVTSNIIFDILFHAWILYSLVTGINAAKLLKAIPDEEEAAPSYTETDDSTENMYCADTDEETGVFIDTDVHGHNVVFRRTGQKSELVIDGRVYDEFVGLIEPAYSLDATVDGYYIEVGFDGGIHVYLDVDGKQILRKKR